LPSAANFTGQRAHNELSNKKIVHIFLDEKNYGNNYKQPAENVQESSRNERKGVNFEKLFNRDHSLGHTASSYTFIYSLAR